MSLKCPAKCGRNVRVGRVLCRDCWYALPATPRAELRRTHRAAFEDLANDTKWAHFTQALRIAVHTLKKAAA